MSLGLANPSLYGLRALYERREFIADLARTKKSLSAAEVRQLRRALFEEAGLSRDEAAALFELDRAQGACAPEWIAFFVGCVTDLIVWQSRPTGVVNGEQAEWLLAHADAGKTLSAFALLANVVAEAHCAPAWFIDAVRGRAAAPQVQQALAASEAGVSAAL